LEAQNPAGSVKDRLSIGMIEWAETHGLLKPGQTVRLQRAAQRAACSASPMDMEV
jgi:hypothetical protein